jgi:hypothetical protein
MKKIVFLIIFIMTISCNQTQEKNESEIVVTDLQENETTAIELEVEVIDPSIVLAESDTILRFTIKGKTKEYIVNKRFASYLSDFQFILNKFENDLNYRFEDTLDITGDGNGNYYSTTIEQKGMEFLLTNMIMQMDSLIWIDTILVDDRFWGDYWWGDSVYFELKPYSLFYTTYKRAKHFILDSIDLNDEQNSHHRYSYYVYLNEYIYDPEYWNDYLDNFKGRRILESCFVAPGTQIWVERGQKFLFVSGP